MPEDLSFLDDRSDAQERAFTQHDTVEFMGQALRPLGLGTISLLERTRNRAIIGGLPDVIDLAGFVLLHFDDEEIARRARAAVWSGTVAWGEFVFGFLQGQGEQFTSELEKLPPIIKKLIDDYRAIQTRTLTLDVKKNHGSRIGSPGSSARSRKKPAGRTKR